LKKLKKIVKVIFILAILGSCLVLFLNVHINNKTRPFIYSSINSVPYNKTGLLLGTSKYLTKGELNPYFSNRISAAVALYRANKIKYIVVSGDNRRLSYNEPMMMKKELVKAGVPDSAIILDFAGFRTFDSVIRCYEIFGQKDFTIISQRFHIARGIYIANHYGIGAIGFEASDVGPLRGLKTNIRELFARVRVYWDIQTGSQPKFLGEKIKIE
jgi:SanA protein